MQRDNLLAAASFYTTNGLHVFALGSTKRPIANCPRCRNDDHDREACECLMCHGFYAATTDMDRVAEMFNAIPDGMLAVRCGAISGIVVIDIDPAHGGQIDTDLMPVTRYAHTGNFGYHLGYRHPGIRIPPSQGRVALGVDVRGDDSYAVLAPSIHPRTGRPYAWAQPCPPMIEMPSALISACLPKPAAATSTSTTAAEGISSPDRLLASILATVERAPEGKRRTTLYGASRGVARMVAAGAIATNDAINALTDAGRSAGQSERETRTAIVGGFRDEGIAA